MDKSWIEIEDRQHPKYQHGVKQFLGFLYTHIEVGKNI